MLQGDAYRQPLIITINGKPATLDDLSDVEVMVGTVRKLLSDAGVSYDADRELFLIDLTQKDTFLLFGTVEVQARCKFKSGDILGFKCGTLEFEKSSSKERL